MDGTSRDLAPLLLGAGTCWHMPPALPVPAASWPVWSLALRALVRIHHCQTLFRTLQKQTHITLSSSDRSRGHGKTKEPHCFDVPFAAWVPSADSFQSAWLSSIWWKELALQPPTPSAACGMRASPLPSALTMVEAGCQSTAGGRRLTPNTKSPGGSPSLTRSPSLRHGAGQGGSPARGPAQGGTPWAVSQHQPSADRDSLSSPRTCSGSSEAGVAGAQTHSTEMRPDSPRGCCTLP